MDALKRICFGFALVLLLAPAARADDKIGQVSMAVVLADGTVMAVGNHFTYVSTGDLKKWRAYPNPDELVGGVFGGSLDRPVIYCQVEREGQLRALSPTTAPVILLESASRIASFFSEKVGCVAEGDRLRITRDGGITWSAPRPVLPQRENISYLLWLSDHELAVAGERRTICCLSVDREIETRWTNTDARPGPLLRLGDDKLLIYGNTLTVLSRAEGKQLATAKADTQRFRAGRVLAGGIVGSEICLFGFTGGMSIWSWDGKELAAKKFLEDTPPILAVMPLGRSVGALTAEGQLCLLEGDRLVPQPVMVEKVKSFEPKPAGLDDPETAKEVAEALSLSKQVDEATRDRIFGEANAKIELSPRQRMLWATDELKRILNSPSTRPGAGQP